MALSESSFVPIAPRDPVSRSRGERERAVVWIGGEHDVATVAELSRTMARAIARDDADVVVDLSGVLFMGAATAEVMVRAREFLAQRSRALALRSPSRCAQRVLDLCDFPDLGTAQ